MVTKHLLRTAACLAILTPLQALASNVLESFTVKTLNVEVRELTESSIQLKSDTNTYYIQLEPNKEGKVIFSLSGIGYATTSRFSNLLFGVTITGFRNDELVYPTFSFDDINKDIKVEHNRLVFQRIYGSIPVWFNAAVDSIQLQITNSLDLNVDQYLGIQDLKIIPSMDIVPNPQVSPCAHNEVMIAIDGSSSIDKNERTLIGEQLLAFIRHSEFTRDSHRLCVLEFGSEVLSMAESIQRRILVDALQKYKVDKNDRSKTITWTNWSIVFEQAILKKPDILVFITDGWSNWCGQPSSFSGQYEHLIAQSNQLKKNGTRLLFITSDLDVQNNAKDILSNFLNNDQTQELHDETITADMNLSDVDLITMQGFTAMTRVNLGSIFDCQEEGHDLAQWQPVRVRNLGAMLGQDWW